MGVDRERAGPLWGEQGAREVGEILPVVHATPVTER